MEAYVGWIWGRERGREGRSRMSREGVGGREKERELCYE